MSGWTPVDIADQIGPMRRYARALTRDDGAADDLVQDALVRAYEKAGSYRPDRPLRSWLLAILHNRFIDGHRRAAAEQRRDRTYAVIRPPVPFACDPEQAVQLREVAARFSMLPEQQRSALHLVAVEGLSYQEAAEALDVPVGTIMSRLARARAAMRAAEAGAEDAAEQGSGRPRLHIIGGSDAG